VAIAQWVTNDCDAAGVCMCLCMHVHECVCVCVGISSVLQKKGGGLFVFLVLQADPLAP